MFNFQKIEIVYYYFDIFLSSLVWFAVTGLNNQYGLSGYFYNTSLPDMVFVGVPVFPGVFFFLFECYL
jgi:hypothetical protein